MTTNGAIGAGASAGRSCFQSHESPGTDTQPLGDTPARWMSCMKGCSRQLYSDSPWSLSLRRAEQNACAVGNLSTVKPRGSGW